MRMKTMLKRMFVCTIILSLLLANFVISTPESKAAESTGRPVTYAKYNTTVDMGWVLHFESVAEADRGTAWVFAYDSISFDSEKRAVSYQTSNVSNQTPWISLFFDKEFTTPDGDYWIAVLFQQEEDKGFPGNLMQNSEYSFFRYNATVSRVPWSYSKITYDGVEYSLAVAKISGWAPDIVVSGVTLFAEKATQYTVYSTAVYLNEEDALSYAGMFPLYEENDYLTYGLYNKEADFKGLKPSGSDPVADPGTVWGSPDCTYAAFDTELKGACFTSQPYPGSWAALYFNEDYITTGDSFVVAVIYKPPMLGEYVNDSLNLIKDYQFGLHTDTSAITPSFSTLTNIDGQLYAISFSRVVNMKAGERITGIRVGMNHGRTFTLVAAAILKNEDSVPQQLKTIVSEIRPLEGDKGRYEGAQIRTTLVPYRDRDGKINTSDLRQGLRFCFTLPEAGTIIEYKGKEYEVLEQKGLIILKEYLEYMGDLTLSNGNIADRLMVQNELIDWGEGTQNYKAIVTTQAFPSLKKHDNIGS